MHREQQKAPHDCCCCRSEKPLDCDGMGRRVYFHVNVSECVCVSEGNDYVFYVIFLVMEFANQFILFQDIHLIFLG